MTDKTIKFTANIISTKSYKVGSLYLYQLTIEPDQPIKNASSFLILEFYESKPNIFTYLDCDTGIKVTANWKSHISKTADYKQNPHQYITITNN